MSTSWLNRFAVSNWYQLSYAVIMAMTLRLTEEETEALRAQAELEHRSMQEVARLAIQERIGRANREMQVRALTREIMARDAGLLRRLGE